MGEERAREFPIQIENLKSASSRQVWNASGDILAIIVRRKWQIALVIFATVVISIAMAQNATPRFVATSTLMLDVNNEELTDVRNIAAGLSSDSREIRSQVEVLLSRKLMARVVDTLDLTNHPYFNPDLEASEPSLLRFLTPSYYIRLARRAVSAAIPSNPGPAGAQEPVILSERDKAIDTLRGVTTVIPVHFSFVFNISVELPDPRLAATVANAIADEYILNQIDLKYERTEQATVWLRQRVDELKTQLQEDEAAIAQFLEASGIRPEETTDDLIGRLSAARSRLDELTKVRAEAVRRLATIDALDAAVLTPAEVAALDEAGTLPGVGRLAGVLESNPATARDTLARAIETQRARAIADSRNADVNLANLQRNIDRLEEQLRTRSDQLTQLGQLQREAQTTGELYQTFLSRLREASVQRGIYTADAVVISEARVPIAPSYPQKMSFVMAGAMFGAILAAVMVGLLEAFDRSFRLPEELESQSGCAVIGSVPEVKLMRGRSPIDYMTKNPTSPFAESIRNLRTSIQLSDVDRKSKVICFTSAVQREGKTTTALATANSFASRNSGGRRTIIIDLDLRVRRVSKLTQAGQEGAGLLAYMRGNATLDEIIVAGEEFPFDVIGVEQTVKVTTDMFSSHRFEQLIADLRQRYDVIVLDTPPVLALPDARLISKIADMTIFAVRWKSTSRYLVQHALRLLNMFGSRNLSMVMTYVNLGKATGYSGYYKYK